MVERTVKDVVPALKTNKEGLNKVLDDLVKQYKTKQDDLDKWKVRFDLKTHTANFLETQSANNLNRRRTTCKSCSNRTS